MEEAGAQVAVPMFAQLDVDYPYHGPPFSAKKRDYLCHQSLGQRKKQAVQPPFEGVRKDWNPSSWHWDSSRFVVRALESGTSQPGKGHAENNVMDGMDKVPGVSEQGACDVSEGEDNDDRLRLNLGGGMKIAEEPVSRPRKRIRPESAGDNYPMCQVDDCREDLSNVKDYHRRHKVCEAHSKAVNALVGKQMQRFCQQCSRFHLLSEFDEGKRSCRRRLAGHNRRRRKTQSEDVNSGIPGQGNKVSNADKNVDIIHLWSSLTRGQGKAEVNVSAGLGREQIVQFLSKINSLKMPTDCIQNLHSYKSDDVASNLHSYKSDDVASGKATSTHQERFNAIPSTADLLTVLSSPLPTSAPNTTAVAVHSPSSEGSDMDGTSKSKGADESIDTVSQKGSAVNRSSVGGERSSTSYQSLVEDSDGQIQQTRPSLHLQLFSSSPEDVSPPKSESKYLSSDGSNPFEEPSRSSSPVVQELFPMRSLKEVSESERSIIREVNGNHDVRSHGHTKPLDLFRDFGRASDDASHQSSPYRAGSISLSTGIAFAPNHTGRIMFKLFDKDPSHLPGSLRSQIFNWLSNSPLDMESYIRPGCVVLSVYVSMPSASWEQLESNFLESLCMLLQSSNCDFWRSGRFLVHASRKLASHKDGRIHEFKSGRASLPELISVSPLAVAGGQETSLVLRGRNMNNPETNIYCTLRGGYMALEVNRVNSHASTFDEVVVCNFKVLTDMPTDSGRCFIEVENGFRGSSFPVIVADAMICKELRLLESELEEDSPLREVAGEMPDFGLRGNQRALVLHFLNELGWLFQRKPAAPVFLNPEVSIGRYKFLLAFSVERDYCALVKKILDMSVEDCFYGEIPLIESLEMLSEIQLLNRAVRRRCRKMVDLLVHFCVERDGDSSPKYLFSPDATGPGGVTPLHVAASTSGSIDIVDALTNDPQEIGLNGWSFLLDANGMSPHAYAKMRNHHSYNELVACKLNDKQIGQICLTVSEDMQDQGSNLLLGLEIRSCARCAAKSVKYANGVPASHGLLHRPFMYSILLIAAVCVCVCLLNRTAPKIGVLEPFIWENLDFGTI
ncbi:hypothetical protein MLD38_035052 [Melastoma candidum]|uniref:Uncharacterized protein n=1 Tax=Melastoma candidum TaxID=119954 RepID=A0ACB9MBV6_9MYRT|nr:hypothetical protein MLD38_035052 [Melastoma candidum]